LLALFRAFPRGAHEQNQIERGEGEFVSAQRGWTNLPRGSHVDLNVVSLTVLVQEVLSLLDEGRVGKRQEFRFDALRSRVDADDEIDILMAMKARRMKGLGLGLGYLCGSAILDVLAES
jgi:hypothetical protein